MEKNVTRSFKFTNRKHIQRKAKQYTGKLTPGQAAEGISRAVDNAKSLVSDAKLLLENKRFARAASLAILAIEEMGKLTILREILLEKGQDGLTKGWRDYRQHLAKNRDWLFEELQQRGATQFKDFAILNDEGSGHAEALDIVKQSGFYSDIDPAGKWTSPEEVITEAAATYLVRKAERSVNRSNSLKSEEELKLFVKHLQPVNGGGSKEKFFAALVRCYAEAEKLGYLEEGMTAKMQDFLSDELKNEEQTH